MRDANPSPGELNFPRWLRISFWISFVISLAVVLRRLFALAYPSPTGPSPGMALDAVFASHTALTLAHILPAAGFVVLIPFVLLAKTNRNRFEMPFYFLGATVGLTAYAMSSHAIGGWIERSAVLVFDSLFLFSLAISYRYRQSNQPFLQRQWLLRAIGILLGIATTRPVMVIFFATNRVTHMQPDQFFGIAFWIGFSINVSAFELWIRSIDRHQKAPVAFRTSQPRSAL
jgi:hypothetical protein